MKVSLNSMQGLCARYGCVDNLIPDGFESLITKIGAQLGEIEDITYLTDKYAKAVIVKVQTVEAHPNADKLHVCTVDDGGKTLDVERNPDKTVQVVCGATNVRAGMLAVWLPPGATVPESYGKEPFVLEARDLRGVVSNGMLASPKELSLGENHDGILEVNDDGIAKVGAMFGDVYQLTNDIQIDIENKMFTHRPDCFGFLGVAREMAGIQGISFKSPEWYDAKAAIPEPEAEQLGVELRNELPTLVPRFMLLPMRDVQVGSSPVWLQVELAKVGVKSINNIVDYTNFFMLETGQPIHAYDYDKVKSLSGDGGKAVIEVRNPRDNERIMLLNGKEIAPRQEAIMIATDKALIGVGGVMGGSDTEVDENTKNIILEVGTFDMYSIRRTSMEHGLFTDAVTRFNKGQSPLQNRAVMAKIVDEIRQYAGGKVAGPVIDNNQAEGREWVHPPVPVTAGFINARLGFNLSPEDIKVMLEHVEFAVAIENDKLTVAAPFWRTDIETREDVVEEVGRLYGFDKLPLELPERSITPVAKDAELEVKSRVRQLLARAGANEVLTYTFVHGDLIEKAGQDSTKAYKLSNALSPDLHYYRLSLTPSLLDKVHMNIKAGYDSFGLFEMGKAHMVGEADESIPKEFERLGAVFAAKRPTSGAMYYTAKRYLGELLGTDYQLQPLEGFDFADHEVARQMALPFEAGRSAVITKAQAVIGVIGEYKAGVRRMFKLPDACAGFELFMSALADVQPTAYVPLPRFPEVTQDITLRVADNVTYEQLYHLMWDELGRVQPDNSLPTLAPRGIYQADGDTNHRNITFRFTLASYERTLTDAEVSSLLETAASAAHKILGAERV